MVNWLKQWRRASYRGAQFWVDKDQVQTGRRLVVHEFPKRDTPYIEDMGRSANKIQVTAYVAGDSHTSDARALFNACQQGGAATLQLPAEKLKAHCESCERAWDKDKQGFIAFSLSFWRDGTGAGPDPAPYLQRLTYSAAGALAEPVAALLAASVQTLGQPGFVRDAAVADVQDMAAAVDAVRVSLTLDPAASPSLARAVQDLDADAVELSAIGTVGDSFTATTFVSRPVEGTAATELASRVATVLEGLRTAAAPENAAREFVPLIEAADAFVAQARTPSRRQQQANAAAFALSLRVLALGQWAVALTEIEYRDRRAAIQARADMSEAIDAVLDDLAGPAAYAAYIGLSAVRDTALRFFTRLLTDLAPIQLYSGSLSMPSLWWANRLYGDAERAGEIAGRNRALHASFMPLDIEALAV